MGVASDTLQIDVNACVTANNVGMITSNEGTGLENLKKSTAFRRF